MKKQTDTRHFYISPFSNLISSDYMEGYEIRKMIGGPHKEVTELETTLFLLIKEHGFAKVIAAAEDVQAMLSTKPDERPAKQ